MPVNRHTDAQIAAAYNDVERYPDIASTAAALGYSPGNFRRHVARLRGKLPLVDRRALYQGDTRTSVPPDRRVRRWLLTAAQDDTPVHAAFWANLQAYAEAIGAEILVGGFTYQKGLFEDHASRTAVFPAEVRPYLQYDNIQCGPLLFAAKMNILPTAVRPLSGLETYSRGAWAVFPHAKVQLVSVPALPGSRPAQVMTTGACTLLRWLRETDPRGDPVNMMTWCELNLEWHRRIEREDSDFDLFRFAVSRHDPMGLSDIVFVPRNGTYQICQDKGGIECGSHGDEGPNGARGSILTLNRVSIRMTVGHGHSPGILDGVHMVGLCGKLLQGYNSGPSAWGHTQSVAYTNSRRTLVTVWDGKWRA